MSSIATGCSSYYLESLAEKATSTTFYSPSNENITPPSLGKVKGSAKPASSEPGAQGEEATVLRRRSRSQTS
jgi:hypothetical protein